MPLNLYRGFPGHVYRASVHDASTLSSRRILQCSRHRSVAQCVRTIRTGGALKYNVTSSDPLTDEASYRSYMHFSVLRRRSNARLAGSRMALSNPARRPGVHGCR
jgi:hypothetical protein